MNVLKKLEYGFKLFCACLFGLSVSLLMAVIVLREAGGISYDFVTDTVIWLTIWATLLLGGPLYGEKGHIAIKMVLEKLPGKSRSAVEIFNVLCTLAFVAILTSAGSE